MTAIRSNGITLEYESLGDPAAPAVLLVMGLGMQLVAWPDPFCERLVQQGFRVVRFDNRDCGLSQKLDELGTPRIGRAMLRALLGPAGPVALRRSTTWRATRSGSWTRSASRPRTSSAPRWAA